MKKTSWIILILTISLVFFPNLIAVLVPEIIILNLIRELLVYIFISLLIWLERDELENFFINKVTFWLFIFLGGVFKSFFGYLYYDAWSGSFLILSMLISSIVLVSLVRRGNIRLPEPSHQERRWILIGLVIGIIFTIILSLPPLLFSPVTLQTPKPNMIGLLLVFVTKFIYELSNAAIPEELIFRGFLWGAFLSLGWSERKTLLAQAILFVLLHLTTQNTYSLFVSTPITALILGALVWRSRSVNSSIVAHAAHNAIVLIFYRIVRLFY